jgi:ankyrin repeat protein
MKLWRRKRVTLNLSDPKANLPSAESLVSDPESEDLFRLAAERGNLDRLTEYSQNQLNVNAPNTDGWTALHLASDKGHFKVVQWLVQNCQAKVEMKTNFGRTALFLASMRGHVEIVQWLIQAVQADVEVKDSDGATALYYASYRGHLPVVQCLIRDGKADVEVKTTAGEWTALHMASHEGHLKVVRYLVQIGKANVDSPAKDGVTALHVASGTGHLETVKFLVLECGANTKSRTSDGETPLDMTIRQGRGESVVKFLSDLQKEGPKAGMEVEINLSDLQSDVTSNAESEDRFRLAAQNGTLEVLMDCSQKPLNVNAPNMDGWTALHLASDKGHLNVVQWLVQSCQANLEVSTHCGRTALFWASMRGHVKIVQWLIQVAHANVEVKDSDGATALYYASYRGHLPVVQCLLRDGKADVDVKTTAGEWTALHVASHDGHLEVVRYLVQIGKADVELPAKDGVTAMHMASGTGHLDIVKFLVLECGASTESRTADGETPLDMTIRQGRGESVVKFLSGLQKKGPKAGMEVEIVLSDLQIEDDVSLQEKKHEQSLAASENNKDNVARIDQEIVNGRMELERMLNNPSAEPTCWSIRYLEDCTDKFNSKVLGEGAFGKVYFGCDKVLGFQFAVKRVPLSVADEDALNEIILSFQREISVRYTQSIF